MNLRSSASCKHAMLSRRSFRLAFSKTYLGKCSNGNNSASFEVLNRCMDHFVLSGGALACDGVSEALDSSDYHETTW
jgi:hypothetical protein